jgi:uncharacterized cupin superfamily protein
MKFVQTFASLADIELPAKTPKPTVLEGSPAEASVTLWTAVDGTMRIGVWECTPGRFQSNREAASETCYILKGRVRLTNEDGSSKEVGAGEMLVLPRGWKGEWAILEETRKIFVIHNDAV